MILKDKRQNNIKLVYLKKKEKLLKNFHIFIHAYFYKKKKEIRVKNLKKTDFFL